MLAASVAAETEVGVAGEEEVAMETEVRARAGPCALSTAKRKRCVKDRARPPPLPGRQQCRGWSGCNALLIRPGYCHLRSEGAALSRLGRGVRGRSRGV